MKMLGHPLVAAILLSRIAAADPADPVKVGPQIARVMPATGALTAETEPVSVHLEPPVAVNATESYACDADIQSIEPVAVDARGVVDATRREYRITFAGPLQQRILIDLPAAVSIDLAVGQHLRGKIVEDAIKPRARVTVDLADDAGPVLLLDPKALATFAPGKPAKARKDDDKLAQRRLIAAKVKGDKTPIELDGWERKTSAGHPVTLFGEAVTLVKGAKLDGWVDRVHFQLIRDQGQKR